MTSVNLLEMELKGKQSFCNCQCAALKVRGDHLCKTGLNKDDFTSYCDLSHAPVTVVNECMCYNATKKKTIKRLLTNDWLAECYVNMKDR